MNQHIPRFLNVSDVLRETIDSIEDRFHHGVQRRTLSTGFGLIDHALPEMKAGSLVLIRSRHPLLASAFLLSVCNTIAVRDERTSWFVSLQRNVHRVVAQLLSMESEIPIWRLTAGALSTGELARLTKAAGRLFESPTYLSDRVVPDDWLATEQGVVCIDGLPLSDPDALTIVAAVRDQAFRKGYIVLATCCDTPDANHRDVSDGHFDITINLAQNPWNASHLIATVHTKDQVTPASVDLRFDDQTMRVYERFTVDQ